MSDAATLDEPFRPMTALKAIGRLFEDPEDTRQVFVVLNALRGRSGRRIFERFLATPTGAMVMAEHRRLLDRLQDRAALAVLPEGSLGRTYLDFAETELLAADGLVGISMTTRSQGVSEKAGFFLDRLRDMHDLTHVLTGYGRDPLGELCLLAFMNRHLGNWGAVLIVLLAMGRFPKGPVGRQARRAVFEAFRNGRRCAWLPGVDWEGLLGEDLAGIRHRLGVLTPDAYLSLQP
jgi:ubiquinone biosynthesis protein COQ4